MKKIFVLILSLLFINAFAAELDSIKFEDKIKLDNKDLVLNGIGIRKATIFKVKVYYGGLYVENKSTDYNTILNSVGPKQIVMNFVHDAPAKKLKAAFSDGIENANKNHEQFKVQLEKFITCVPDVVPGDKFVINFHTDGVQLTAKGKTCDKVSGGDFSKALLSIWFINPADENLRKGLLGL